MTSGGSGPALPEHLRNRDEVAFDRRSEVQDDLAVERGARLVLGQAVHEFVGPGHRLHPLHVEGAQMGHVGQNR